MESTSDTVHVPDTEENVKMVRLYQEHVKATKKTRNILKQYPFLFQESKWRYIPKQTNKQINNKPMISEFCTHLSYVLPFWYYYGISQPPKKCFLTCCRRVKCVSRKPIVTKHSRIKTRYVSIWNPYSVVWMSDLWVLCNVYVESLVPRLRILKMRHLEGN